MKKLTEWWWMIMSMIFDDRDQYTISLRWIIESYSQETPDISTDDKIKIGIPKLFNFDFPIFNESYRQHFEDQFVRHFYFNEINITSIGQWKFMLRERLNLIMPYYNKMYEIQAQKINPLIDTEMNETYTRDNTSNGTTESNGTETSNSNIINSDFPQGTMANKDYASSGTETDNSNNVKQNAKSSATGKETFSRQNSGFSSKSQQALIVEYYESLRNIDEMVFNECKDLFILLY